MTKHETERLAVVEQKLNDHDRRFDELTNLVKEVITKVDNVGTAFVSRGEFDSFKEQLKEDGNNRSKLSDLIKESLVKTLIPIILIGLMFVVVAYINYTVLKVPK